MKDKFLKPDSKAKIRPYYNPVDYFNREIGDFVQILNESKRKNGQPLFEVLSATQAVQKMPFDNNGAIVNTQKKEANVFYDPDTKLVKFKYAIKYKGGITKERDTFTLFELITILKFDGNQQSAQTHVEFRLMKKNVPFIRVGNDYFKLLMKENRYEIEVKTLKRYNRQTVIDDYGREILKDIPKYDDFILKPDNINYRETYNNLYNLYSKFPHEASKEPAKIEDFPHINMMLKHVFGEQVELGYKYFKVLYMHPRQILPVLVLASTERKTGKTTLMNFMEILFGDNYVQISPGELTGNFNSQFANKNIIAIDETVMEKREAVEKVKAVATQKSISVNQKHISQFKIDFFGKLVIGTNREEEFMKIDEEEIRFWVRKVPTLKKEVTDIETKMTTEIPKFLRYLQDLPEIDFSQSRMVFTKDEIKTEQLKKVVENSKVWLYHDVKNYLEDYFNNVQQGSKELVFTAKDLKDKFYPFNHQVTTHYITRMLKDNFKATCADTVERYYNSFEAEPNAPKKVGKPFRVTREMVGAEVPKEDENDDGLPY